VDVAASGDIFDLDGRVALVTGASSGLGRRFAQVLAAAGAEVVASARRLHKLDELALAERIVATRCDVADAAERESLVAGVVERHGRIDVLVNCAGVGGIEGPAEDDDIRVFERVVDVNLVATYAMCQLAGKAMLGRGGGSIVNVASALGMVASAPITQAGYCASKAGVINLTRELAAQWARRGVRVNAIAPGFFPSEMTSEAFANERSLAYIRRQTPLGRGGEEGELDGVLLLLAGPAGSYVVGQTIAVDGGWTI
jgi:NAD(P)-dependent dehydrogenase (short-subunit alcohol dehydrogenase family)